MTQVFINEINPPKQPPQKAEDFVVFRDDETFISVPILGKFLPIKKDLLLLFQEYYKQNKEEVENFCENFWK